VQNVDWKFHSFTDASEFCSVTVLSGFETAFTFMELKKELNSGWLEKLLLVAVRDKRILTPVISTTIQKCFSNFKL
jgi:hypothetical protein